MHVRRAVLLFAIVLGLAALAASISPPPERQEQPVTQPREGQPEAGPRARRQPPARVRFRAGRPSRQRLTRGAAATVVVSVREPGQVELDGLGLVSAAEPRTPATFELLAGEPGRYRVLFTPAGDERSQRLGELVIEA
jgi:hypothetical protein